MNKLKISIGKLNFWVNQDGYESYWQLVNQGKWEPETFSVFDSNLDEQTLFIDVGGWIGSTSLYAAQIAKKTLILEPDHIAYKRLQENFDLNLNILPREKTDLLNLALWHKETSISFFSYSQPGDSSSSVVRNFKKKNKSAIEKLSFDADTITFSKLIKQINLDEFKKIFVKIDIEGAEYQLFDFLLDQLSNINASFLVSVHPWLIQKNFKKGVKRRFQQALEHLRFCQKIKKNSFNLFTSNKNLPYIPIINAIGWVLIGRMHQDILVIPKNID